MSASERHNQEQMQRHYHTLSHQGLGVTELRILAPKPRVAYVDTVEDFMRLCLEMDGKVPGIYVGVQPRPAEYFDLAPNKWTSAIGGTEGNCAKDNDIEYLTNVFFDIDVDSPMKKQGHPASDTELQKSFQAAELIARLPEFEDRAVIGCSGNGHYVLASLVPILVYGQDTAWQYKCFCQNLVQRIVGHLPDAVRIDPVYNLSRIMRVMGTVNQKGSPIENRPHRQSYFVSRIPEAPSLALHHRILNMDVGLFPNMPAAEYRALRGNLKSIEQCQFIQWCREYPQLVSEPQWFGLITNLAHLAGGGELIHEISRLDTQRYDYQNTENMINRVIQRNYRAVHCRNLIRVSASHPRAFKCTQIANCPARAPMYMAVNRIV